MIPHIIHFVWIGSELPAWGEHNVAEFRRLNPRQQDDLLEYLRDAADAEEGRARKRGVRRPEKDPPPKLIETVNPDSEREA